MLSSREIAERFLASLLVHAQLTGTYLDLSTEDLIELLEAINAENEPSMNPDRFAA